MPVLNKKLIVKPLLPSLPNLQQQTQNIIVFLKEEKILLPDKNICPYNLINKVYKYMDSRFRRAIICHVLLKDSGLYGAKIGEHLSIEREQFLLHRWVCQLIFDCDTVDQFVITKVIEKVRSGYNMPTYHDVIKMLVKKMQEGVKENIELTNMADRAILHDIIYGAFPLLRIANDNLFEEGEKVSNTKINSIKSVYQNIALLFLGKNFLDNKTVSLDDLWLC